MAASETAVELAEEDVAEAVVGGAEVGAADAMAAVAEALRETDEDAEGWVFFLVERAESYPSVAILFQRRVGANKIAQPPK